MPEPETKKSIVPPPPRGGRRPATKPAEKPAPVETKPVPGESGAEPLVAVFEHADVKWAPADAAGVGGTPIGYELAKELKQD